MANDLNRSIKIYIDSSDAMKKASELKTKISTLEKALSDLDAQGKKDTPEYTRKAKALQELQGSYARYEQKVRDVERVLKNLSGATKTELLMAQKEVRKSMKDVERGTDEYNAKLKTLLSIKAELAIANREERLEMGKQATMWDRVANGFNKYFGVVTAFIAGITGVSFTLRKLAQDNAALDDVYSDVMKTTGNTRDEVLSLNETFKAMDTRTLREQLNMLARDAGKLGLSGRKDLLDFVEAGNQINVALGDDLGDGAIKNIGKMTEVYALSTKEMDKMDLKGKMLAVGSAINELGQSSTAAEPYMVNFTQRLGGVAAQAGISIQNVLGFASALDQSGQAVEMSATALQKFIMSVMGDPAKFARIAGIEVQKFTKLLQTDANQAIKDVLASLSQKGGFQQLIPVFKEMGLDGARAVGVLAALATNIKKVDEAQRISNEAFSEGVSITEEYNIKNNNLQAQLEKNRKAFSDAALELGERLSPVLLQSTKWTTYFIKLLPSMLDFLEKYGKYLLYAVGGYAAYVAAIKTVIYYENAKNVISSISRLATLANAKATALSTGNTIRAAAAEKLYNAELATATIGTRIYTAATSLLSAGKYLLTGNITKARAALQTFNTTLSLNPAGMIGVAVMGLVTALGYLYYKTRDVMTAQKAIKEATEEMNNELAREQSEANALFEALKRVNPESAEAEKIKKKIIDLYGPYLQGMIDEKGNLIDIAQAQEIVNTKIREQIALKIKNAATDKIQEKSIQKQISDMDSVMDNIEKQMKKNPGFNQEASNVIRENINKAISEAVNNGKTGVVELMDIVQDVIKSEGLDMHKKFGAFDPKSLYQEIATLTSGIYHSQGEIKKVTEQYAGLISDATELNSILGGTDDMDGTIPTDNGTETKASKQKKALNLALESLETTHQNRLTDIKKQYRDGEITSESDFNQKIFAQDQAYYILRDELLTNFLKTVSDKELRSDIEKQIAIQQQKRLDDELRYRKKVEQILLDANPEEKERVAYENRLRDAGLFNVDREKLSAESLQALELLEKQHQNNIDKIQKQGAAMAKADAETKFKESFEAQKEKLQEELNVLMADAATLSSHTFEAEMLIHQKRLELIRAEMKARSEAGLDISKQQKAQGKEEANMTATVRKEVERRSALYAKHGDAVGQTLGQVMTGQVDMLEGFGSTTLDIMFDIISEIIQGELTKVMATSTSAIMRATAEAMATPGSALTFGAKGFATAAILTGAITAATAVAKSALKGMLGKRGGKSSGSSSDGGGSSSSGSMTIKQRARGNYSVIGEEDGKTYNNVPFTGMAQTGIVASPTLVGETGRELIVSAPDLQALQRHMNYPIIVQALNEVRSGAVPQRAQGNYSAVENTGSVSTSSNDTAILVELTKALKDFTAKDMTPTFPISELQGRIEKFNQQKAKFSQPQVKSKN